MSSQSLTSRLLATHPAELRTATSHSFLRAAGNGSLQDSELSSWLVQDKYYQYAYITFVSRLISKLDTESSAFSSEPAQQSLQWKTFTTLLSALDAIKAEIEFYDEVAERYSLSLVAEPANETTIAYRDFFLDVSAPDRPLLDGLCVLWATEVVYLKVWSFVKHTVERNAHHQGANDGDVVRALHEAFIPNWTNEGFVDAVKGLADLVDEWSEGESSSDERCEGLWSRVLHLEAKFWPNGS